jgi:predicted esterase
MKNLFLLLLVCAASHVYSQTRINAKIEVDSVEREFIVVIPSGGVPVGGYPMVFMFHGTSGDGEKFYNISGWKEKGETEKIVTVFPSSLRYCVTEDSAAPHMTTKWNNGDLQTVACPGQTLKDDVKFVRMMVDTITKLLSIDRTRIYASGFSNGGVFTSKLAVEASDIFAAITTSAGPMMDSGSAKRMIPTTFSLGTLDDRFCGAFGVAEIPFNDSAVVMFRGFNNRFLKIFGLSNEYTKDSVGLVLRYHFNSLAIAANWEFNFVLFDGLTHGFPNGINYPLSAPDLFWPFFQQYTLPLSVQKSDDEIHPIYLRPNPAMDYIIVDEDATVTLFTSTGAEVFTTKAMHDERIALPKLAAGVYIAKIETKSGVKSAKVVVQ